MPQVVLKDHEWCKEHAKIEEGGFWRCKKTGAEIMAQEIGRTLHDGPFPLSGSGQVPLVLHLHCPACDPDWKSPSYGTPIDPEEIITFA